MSEKHFLVQGAQCQCNNGAKPDKLVVLSQNKEYINDSDGSQKLIANTLDLGVPFEAKTFGACNITDSACVPAVTAWTESYQKIKLSNGGNILTEDSKAVCSVGGSACISVLFHGQTAALTSAHFDQTEIETLSILNPMAPPPRTEKKELPKVKTIKLGFEKRKENKTFHSSNNEKGKVQKIVVRKDESMKFEVESYYNTKTADTSKVGWKVVKAHAFEGETQSFSEAGPTLTLNFDAVGKYRVVAFGSSEETKQNDTACSLDIEVKDNTLKDDFKLDAATSKKAGGTYFLRRGVSTTVEAMYEFEPSEEERKRVHMILTDETGNILQTTESGIDKITFTPANTAAVYIVTAVMSPENPAEGEDIHINKTFNTQANGVVAVACAQGETVRPGTTMVFTATELTYSTLVQDFETAAIKWQLNGKEVGSGRSITLDGKQYFSKEGKYVVEAYVVKANAWNTQKNIPGKDEKDDWRFTVQYNKIKSIEGPKEWITGKKYDLRAVTDMPYDRQKDGDIDWKTPNGTGLDEGEMVKGVYLNTNTKSQVIAFLESTGQSVSLNVQAKYAVIERWCFTDEKSVYKSHAGWGEVLTAIIKCKDAAGEKVDIHLLEYDDSDDSNYIKDLGQVTFDAEGIAKISFRTDDIKKALNALYFEGTYYEVYFGILKKDDGIQFADMKTKESDDKKFLFPKKENSHTDQETAKYVYINGSKEIVSAKFLDSSGYPAYRIYRYGEKLKIHIQTRNLAEEKFTYQMWENKSADTDILIQESSFTVGKNELVVLDLDTGKMKPKNKADELKVRLFYVILKHPETHKVVYPKQLHDLYTFNPGNANYYVHLKLSGDLKLNETLKVIAPVVLGEKLEGEEKTSQGICYCNKDFTVAEMKDMVLKVTGQNKIWSSKNAELDDESYERLTKELNFMFRKYGINKCIQKIAILAMTGGETGFFQASGEALSKYASSQFNYKGRGMLQLTGDTSTQSPGAYEDYNNFTGNKYDLVKNPGKIASSIYLCIDSAGWYWTKYKKCPNYSKKSGNPAIRWKAERFEKALKKNLNDIALLMEEDEERYFFLIAKLSQGYFPNETTEIPESLHYDKRLDYVKKLKSWFKYDKSVCKTGKKSTTPTGKAPWMPFALAEIGESAIAGSSNNSRIDEYFNASSNGKGLNEETNWCGAFASWCFSQAGYEPPPLSCRAAMWQFWHQIETPIYGAAAVIDWDDNQPAGPSGNGGVGGSGHITFVVGISDDRNYYYCVGGNQGGTKGARQVKISKYSASDIDWFVIPPDYNPTDDEYNLRIMTNETDVDSQNTTRD